MIPCKYYFVTPGAVCNYTFYSDVNQGQVATLNDSVEIYFIPPVKVYIYFILMPNSRSKLLCGTVTLPGGNLQCFQMSVSSLAGPFKLLFAP